MWNFIENIIHVPKDCVTTGCRRGYILGMPSQHVFQLPHQIQQSAIGATAKRECVTTSCRRGCIPGNPSHFVFQLSHQDRQSAIGATVVNEYR